MTRWFEDPWVRRSRLRIAAVVAVLLALLVGVTLWQPGRARAAEDEVVELASVLTSDSAGSEDALAGVQRTQVRLPGATVDLLLGEPVDRLTAQQRTDDEDTGRDVEEIDDYFAPRGDVFVPVSWEWRDPDPVTTGFDFDAARAAVAEAQPRLILTVDGESRVAVDLEGPYGTGDHPEVPALALAVDDGDVGLVGAVVEFDGVRQTADLTTGEVEAGVAAALYGHGPDETALGSLDGSEKPDERAGCGWTHDVDERLDPERGFACAIVGARRSPWLPERGWVEEAGQEWLWLRSELRVPFTFRRPDGTRVFLSAVITEPRANGVAAVEAATGARSLRDDRTDEVTYLLDATDGGTDVVTLTASATAPLEDVDGRPEGTMRAEMTAELRFQG